MTYPKETIDRAQQRLQQLLSNDLHKWTSAGEPAGAWAMALRRVHGLGLQQGKEQDQ